MNYFTDGSFGFMITLGFFSVNSTPRDFKVTPVSQTPEYGNLPLLFKTHYVIQIFLDFYSFHYFEIMTIKILFLCFKDRVKVRNTNFITMDKFILEILYEANIN